MIEKLKSIPRVLLELRLGILFTGLVVQLVGMWFADNWILYTVALWIGIIVALWMIHHMYLTLDRTLDMGAAAQKAAMTANLVRYACVVVVFLAILLTRVLNPLITFMGVMSVKVAAYLQPFTHKLCNKLFHETDPIPQPMSDEEETQMEKEDVSINKG